MEGTGTWSPGPHHSNLVSKGLYKSMVSSHCPPKGISIIREPSFLVLLAPYIPYNMSKGLCRGNRISSTALIPDHLPPITIQW